jgi:hypothetical protein
MLLLLPVALVSAEALAFEVLLTRLFSIVQWHHFAYIVRIEGDRMKTRVQCLQRTRAFVFKAKPVACPEQALQE